MSPVFLRHQVAAVALSVLLAGCAASRPVSQADVLLFAILHPASDR
ncbi:hypothetical protein LAUMK13_00860 [Mycobacterium innocens]|uniref:Uncharacterized protein n=1 Tax=Mycobacterium innocens TaxID=2341083 RepID=A0A498PSS3_9MYCO|nr:hypothetical protein LAUMK13_00860 [Mycobacterium innocens]